VVHCTKVVTQYKIKGDSGGKVSILGGDNIGHCEEKGYVNMCLILNC
jgi:hypothetical protein